MSEREYLETDRGMIHALIMGTLESRQYRL